MWQKIEQMAKEEALMHNDCIQDYVDGIEVGFVAGANAVIEEIDSILNDDACFTLYRIERLIKELKGE